MQPIQLAASSTPAASHGSMRLHRAEVRECFGYCGLCGRSCSALEHRLGTVETLEAQLAAEAALRSDLEVPLCARAVSAAIHSARRFCSGRVGTGCTTLRLSFGSAAAFGREFVAYADAVVGVSTQMHRGGSHLDEHSPATQQQVRLAHPAAPSALGHTHKRHRRPSIPRRLCGGS